MSTHPKRGWPSRATAAVLSAAVFAASLGPGTAALAADVVEGSSQKSSAQGGVLKIPTAAPGLSAPMFSPPPVLAPALTELGGHSRPRPSSKAKAARFASASPAMAAPAPATGPALAAPAGPLQRLRALFPRASAPAAAYEAGGSESADAAKFRADSAFDAARADLPSRSIDENLLGFRAVRGVVHNPALGRLPADADAARIVEQFAEFGLSREKTLELGRSFGLSETSPRKRWLAVYDSLKARNVAAGKRHDSRKYEGQSFRALANLSYAPGWPGALRRAAELHKHVIGLAFRVPYHLFDMFFFGYFRQAIAFEFFHDGEDFLALSEDKDLSEKHLAAAMEAQTGAGFLAEMRSRAWFRRAERWLLTPLAVPLAHFMARRLTLAAICAVVSGGLAGLVVAAPWLPFSFALTSLGWGIGPALVWALNGLPVLTAAVPGIGHFLAPVASAAIGALMRELVLGPLLQALLLSTFLTLPRIVSQRLAAAQDLHPRLRLTAGEWARAAGGALISGQFLRANVKSFFGLITVGAEISGILKYAGQMDAAVDDRGFHAATGRHFGFFHAVGAFVDGQNGAISWGGTVLQWLQDATGVHLSEAAMAATLGGRRVSAPAASVLSAAEAGAEPPFDPDLWKKSPAEAAARIAKLAASAGGIDGELAAVSARTRTLSARLGDDRAKLAALLRQSKPVTRDEYARRDRLLRNLGASSDESYVRSKLAEASDLKTPPVSDKARLKRLEALQAKYRARLPPPPPDRNGYWEQLASREASLRALSERLKRFGQASDEPNGLGMDPGLREQIESLLADIRKHRDDASAEILHRQATRSALQAANEIRNHARRARNSGEDMRRFHADFAKGRSVTDFALALKEISDAQAAISTRLKPLLRAKQAAVDASRARSAAEQKPAAAGAAKVGQWRADAQGGVDGDLESQRGVAGQEAQANAAAERTAAFAQEIHGLLAGIEAMDRGSSPDAATQYQKNLDKLAQVARWRDSGNPDDPGAFSLRGFQSELDQVNDYLSQAQQGLDQIAGADVEHAAVLMIELPGPRYDGNIASEAQMRQLLADRKTYWQSKLATYQADLDQVNKLKDPDAVTVDEFGLTHGYNKSKQNMATLHPNAPAAGSKADARQDMEQLDAIAAQLNAAGARIPLLSGLSLSELQATIKTYGEALRAVKPGDAQSQMNLIHAAQLMPMLARAVVNWSVDQATVDAFDQAKAPGGALTTASAGLTGIIGMLRAILADVDADVAYVNSSPPNTPAGDPSRQALIDRKAALLKSAVIPALKQAQVMLGAMISYQRDSIASVAGDDGMYRALFGGEQALLAQTRDLYDKTLPWALASFGGPQGDVPASLASIEKWKKSLQQRLDDVKDSNGNVVQEGIRGYQQDMKDRLCESGCTRTEIQYDQTQPYSLPAKIAQYTAERAQRAAEINAQSEAINGILEEIQTLSRGKYDLRPYRLPTGVGADAASVARIQLAVDQSLIPNLGAQMTKIADAEKAAGGGGLTLSIGGNGAVPTGVQPPPTVSESQRIALLAKDVGVRLLPSATSRISETNAPATYSVLRLIYSDAVVTAAQDALTNQVPKAVAMLDRASTTLNNAIAQTSEDVAYVNSNGASETPEALYARKAALFRELGSLLNQGGQFYGQKAVWDQGAFGSVQRMQTYYDSLTNIYANAQSVSDSETTVVDTELASLQAIYDNLDKTKQTLAAYLSQLNPREQSAWSRIGGDVSAILDKDRAVAEANFPWHDLQDQLARSGSIISADLTELDQERGRLAELLSRAQGPLPADLAAKLEALHLGAAGAVGLDGPDGQTSIVVKKAEFSAFLDTMLAAATSGARSLAQKDAAAIKEDLLAHPQGLAAFIPGSGVVDFGDDADGFYLVYQSKFSVPHGLETGNWVTLGNVAHFWGNGVSVGGYAFSSPPGDDGSNAPYGDKGVEVQVESLQDRGSVNYLTVDLHRFGLDIPADNTVAANAAESRLMILEDRAALYLGGKLYVGAAGYGDMALDHPGDHPYYYGGNLKTSLKLVEWGSLDASEQALYAKDPRRFLMNINLDFTGHDPSLNQDVPIATQGGDVSHSRAQIGPHLDVNRLLNPQGGGETFTVDLFYANTRGTDDLSQESVGATVVKGFSIKNDAGKTWLSVDNRATGEIGREANTLGDSLAFTLPDQGVTLSGEGKLIGGAGSHYAQIVKTTGDNASIALGYGSQYVGQNDRLSIAMNTSFTLAQLWQSVADNSAKALQGGETLRDFNADIDGFFAGDSGKSSRAARELERVFKADVARALVAQDVGALTRDIAELRAAGAIPDNTRVRGMVGFTSNAASNDKAELAIGGHAAVGAFTEAALSREQRALVEKKSASLYREGLRLQDRLLEIARDWQSAVVDVAQEQWNLRIAGFERESAASGPLRAEAEVRVAAARKALHQALQRYNAMAGRDLDAPSPFADLDAQGLRDLMDGVKALIAAPDRYAQILAGLDKNELEKKLGPEPFNLMDWLPFVDRLTVGFGVQYQDMMNSQVLTLGAGVRLPIYDPSSGEADKSYRLEASAAMEEMEQAYRQRALRAAGERERARAWSASAAEIAPRVPAADRRAADAIRRYRNGLIDADALRVALDDWRWYASMALRAQSQASLAEAQRALDAPLLSNDPLPSDPARVSSLQDAVDRAVSGAHDLKAVADRAQAADVLRRAEDRVIEKLWLDVNVGAGLNAQGPGWIPSIGVTGIPVTPVFGFAFKPEELRELQVAGDSSRKARYDALKTGLEAGLAARLYQDAVAYRRARASLALYRDEILPALPAGRGRDQALLEYHQAELKLGQARAALNLLLGRAADAPLEVDIDEQEGLAELSRLLAVRKPAEAQRRILQARVDEARAEEAAVDKGLREQQVQLEPVSLVLRAFGRVVGALAGGPAYDPGAAAAARLATVTDENALKAYGARRADQEAKLRVALDSARVALDARKDAQDPQSRLRRGELEGTVSSLKAGLLAIGADPDAEAPRGSSRLPSSWAELKSRLADAERDLSPARADAEPAASAAAIPLDSPPSAAYARYDYAVQTMGRSPLGQSHAEGWIEVRLKDPNTPPSVALQLEQLRADAAESLLQIRRAGAAARAAAAAAQFESDVLLSRRARGEKIAIPGLDERLNGERGRLIALLGLPPDTGLQALAALVPESASADRLIADMRDRELDLIRRTLSVNGLSQVTADEIAERMSYKGFTLAAASGIFRGTSVSGVFLEASDPRAIERALENMISDVLRKRLEGDGRMRELALRFSQLQSGVRDGVKELESRRREIEAAEADLKARAALRSGDTAAAQRRLIGAWSRFGATMTAVKSDFIALATELAALGSDSEGAPRSSEARPHFAPRGPRSDARSELVDYWAERMADPVFAEAQDALLARLGAAAPAAERERIRDAGALYRRALQNGDAVRGNGFAAAEKLDLLTRNDAEGKRLLLRSAIERELARFGAFDPHDQAAADLLAFFRADAEKSADAGTADRARKRAVAGGMRRAFLGGARPTPAVSAAFDRLEALDRTLDVRREDLLSEYLTQAGDDPKDFVLKDITLDGYLKAQSAFDAELARTLESPGFDSDPGRARLLDALYDVRASLGRAADQARSGRGMAALDALIMLEETRLRAARWSGRSPTEIDTIAQALQNLRGMRSAWADRGRDSDLEPVYALTRLGAGGERTWSVDRWLTREEVASRLQADPKKPARAGEIVSRGGRLFMDGKLETIGGKAAFVASEPAGATVRDELIGGEDAARSELADAARNLGDNETAADLARRMKDADFVAVGGRDDRGRPLPSGGLSFDDVFVGAAGKPGLSAQGRLFFFDSGPGGRALTPPAALSLPPEKVVIKYYDGGEPPPHDRFPTLQSLRDSDAASRFRTLAVSPSGAAALAGRARADESASRRRGWVSVKLNSFGFARDAGGRLTRLYPTREDFSAQWNAYDRAESGLAGAKAALAQARSEENARKAGAEAAQAAYAAAESAFAAVREAPAARAALGRQEKAAQEVKDSGRSDGPEKTEFDAAVRAYQDLLDSAAEKRALDDAAKAKKEADDRLREAHAKAVNAAKAADDAAATLAQSRTWTLYRSDDLDLWLDRDRGVVRAAAPAARGAPALNEDVAGGGPAASRLAGELSAAVLDADGRLVRAYATSADVDAAAAGWALMAYSAGPDVDARLADGSVRAKARISHYEENGLPVLLSARYLTKRLDGARWKSGVAEHGAIMPGHWADILLEIPREIAQAPAEILGGRDLNSSHYLGRARMYAAEGGEAEHRDFWRTFLGAVDVLNLLPDPVVSYYDPSQFPDAVAVDSPLKPGEILADKRLRGERGGRAYDVEFGAAALSREARWAGEDLDAARERTLALFNGGVEKVVVETRRGRDGEYQDASVAVGPGADGGAETAAATTPDAWFIDRVSRRVIVYPGAAGYAGQARAMDGYGARVAEKNAENAAARPALEDARTKADALLKDRLADRDHAARAEQEAFNAFHRIAERVGLQQEIERRLSALKDEIAGAKAEIGWWRRYAARLDAARRGGGPVIPGKPDQPGQPGHPGGPGHPGRSRPHPMVWVWALSGFGLAALLTAFWGLARRPRPR